MTSWLRPPVDDRTEAGVAAELRKRIANYTAWRHGDAPDPGEALVQIFSRFAGILIDRLNRTPDKAFLAFLNLIGISQLPPEPAIAPLTFHLAQGATGDAHVPDGTRVAATAAPGESDPPVFETTGELFLTSAELVAAYASDPARDTWSDLSGLIGSSPSLATVPGAALVGLPQPVPRRLWIADQMFAGQGPRDLTMTISAEPTDGSFPELQWARWDGAMWQAFDAASLEATRSDGGLELTFKAMQPVPVAAAISANGVKSAFSGAWIGAALSHDFSASPPQRITATKIRISSARDKITPDAVFSGPTAVDVSKDFLPFGERPKLGDDFLLTCDDVFAAAGPVDGDNHQFITLTLTASDLPDGRLPSPDPAAKDDGQVTLAWEYWNGSRWSLLGQSDQSTERATRGGDADYKFSDGTRAFMAMKQAAEATIRFLRPKDWMPSAIAGQLHYWLRVRIAGGGYGRDARYLKTTTDGEDSYILDPATWRPPSLSTIACSYTYTSPAAIPRHVLLEGNFLLQDQTKTIVQGGAGFTLSPAPEDMSPALYLGFVRPGAVTAFADQPVTLYFGVEQNVYQKAMDDGPTVVKRPPEIAWEYRDAQGDWRWLGAQDQTAGFTRRGLVTFIAPPDLALTTAFGRAACWLRARWDGSDALVLPRLNRILTNTVWAHHATGITGEVIGSGTGEPDQTFSISLAPVLNGQRVEVREVEPPTAADQAALGADAMTLVVDDVGSISEIWVRWQEVPDFYASTPASRHYSIDRLNGIIAFGDGTRGRSPPRGSNNIRVSYQSGGGTLGNRPAGSISQMRSALPYVDSVSNFEAAAGGADEQSIDEARRHGPAVLRHQNRAVAIVDYEDLAFNSSPAVARAKGIAAHDSNAAGKVQLIVVPRGSEIQPVPSLELLQQVQDTIAAIAPPTVDLTVRGPDWLPVSVLVQIAPASLDGAMDLRNAVRDRLAEFLHPLTGGLDGEGWEFGRRPHQSDFYSQIAQIPGVDHVEALTVTYPSDPPPEGDATLIYAGNVDVTLVASHGANT